MQGLQIHVYFFRIYFLKRSLFFLPLIFRVPYLRSISFLSGYFPSYWIPPWVSHSVLSWFIGQSHSLGWGRKIARRQINDPFSTPRKMPAQEWDTGPAEAETACIPVLRVTHRAWCTQLRPTHSHGRREERFRVALSVNSIYCFLYY